VELAALAAELEFDAPAAHLHVPVAHGGQAEGIVLLGVALVADADAGPLEQLHDERQHLAARQSRKPHVGAHLAANARQGVRELGEELEGLCHISELSDERVERPEDVAQLGQEMDFKILRIEPADQKIGLSHRSVGKGEEPVADTKIYSSEAKGGMASLGELANLKFGAATEEAPVEEDPEEKKRQKKAAKKAKAEEFAAKEAEAQKAAEAGETPDETAPADTEAVLETPAVTEPAEEAPTAEAAVVEETLVEEIPIEETPVEETPVEETPVEETTVEETPVEEAKVEEPAADSPARIWAPRFPLASRPSGRINH